MAQKVITEVICDITGNEAQETVNFAVRGKAYEIDLSAEALADFNAALAGFVESARPVGKVAASRASSNGTARASVDREQSAAVREWARKNGYEISDRGRISASVQQAFDEAHKSGAAV